MAQGRLGIQRMGQHRNAPDTGSAIIDIGARQRKSPAGVFGNAIDERLQRGAGLGSGGCSRPEHDEFVTAITTYHVFAAQRSAQAFSHDLEKLIAHVMPKAIVDLFEAVEIHKSNESRGALAAG